MSTYSFFPGMAMGREWLYNTGTFSLSNLLFAFFYLLKSYYDNKYDICTYRQEAG